MTWQLRALGILVEELGSVPSTHMEVTTVCYSSSKGSVGLFRPLACTGRHVVGKAAVM